MVNNNNNNSSIINTNINNIVLLLLLLLLFVSTMTSFVSGSGDLEEFLDGLNSNTTEEEICQMETFEGRCPEGHVLLVRSARLGRLKLGNCVSSTFGNIGCYTDVLPEMEMYCSGKSSCSVKIDDQSFKRGTPCHKELKISLWVLYTCIPVIVPTSGCGTIRVTTSGFLSSHATHEAIDGCGGLERPWRLEADDGLQINLTMIDFAFSISRMVMAEAKKHNMTEVQSSTYPESCRVYAIIREPQAPGTDPLELSRVATICGWSERVSNIFLSTRNRLEIRLSRSYHHHHHQTPHQGIPSDVKGNQQAFKLQKRHIRSADSKAWLKNSHLIKERSAPNISKHHHHHPQQQQKQQQQQQQQQGIFQYTTQPQAEFLFHFQVVGCPNPTLSGGMWMRRNRNLLVIGCHEGKYHDTWTLTCVDSTWQGSYGDCSTSGVLNMSDNVNISSTAIFILGIAILVSIVILIGGIICIRRIHPATNHCLRDHYGDVPTSGGYGTASTTPSYNKLHVTGSCPSDYGGSGNDYARMRLQQRLNNYPGDYPSMASLMTYEPTRAPTFQTNLASGSVQPLHYPISPDLNYPDDEGEAGMNILHQHAIIDGNRLRHLVNTGNSGQNKSGKFGISCGNLGQLPHRGIVAGAGRTAGQVDHQKSVSEPQPLFEDGLSPHVMDHIYESPDTLLLKRKEIFTTSTNPPNPITTITTTSTTTIIPSSISGYNSSKSVSFDAPSASRPSLNSAQNSFDGIPPPLKMVVFNNCSKNQTSNEEIIISNNKNSNNNNNNNNNNDDVNNSL